HELLQSQQRLADTISQIRLIEIKSIKDKNQVRRMKRENEIQTQQTSMRQQKESEFLREIQLCKARQLGEINDLEIRNMEEIDELIVQHRMEEYQLLEKQTAAEYEMTSGIARQKFNLEAGLLQDKQKDIRTSSLRTQKRADKVLAKAQRVAIRGREKGLLAEHPIILGDTSSIQNSFDDGQSESESNSESNTGSSITGGSALSLNEDEVKPVNTETEKNSAMNRATQVLSEHEKEIVGLTEAGNERLKSLAIHHKKVLGELRQLQRTSISQKNKDHRRKLSDLLKEHEEEVEQIKVEQAATMQ
ncbi:hypothetical protein HDU99_005331, partial [Rhizoclosmatium hyalinum]